MKTVYIPVQFNGVIAIKVPEHLSTEDACLLGTKIGLANILATTDNPDAAEEVAFDDYEDQCSEKAKPCADEDWNDCFLSGVTGKWEVVTPKVVSEE